MKINIENLQKLVRITYPETERKVITTITESTLDENSKVVRTTVKKTEKPREESIDSVKYEMFSKLIDLVLYPPIIESDGDSKDGDSWKDSDNENYEELTSYQIAYNTLIEYKILDK